MLSRDDELIGFIEGLPPRARLMGVDPFDQPAVELAKVLTRERVAALP